MLNKSQEDISVNAAFYSILCLLDSMKWCEMNYFTPMRKICYKGQPKPGTL